MLSTEVLRGLKLSFVGVVPDLQGGRELVLTLLSSPSIMFFSNSLIKVVYFNWAQNFSEFQNTVVNWELVWVCVMEAFRGQVVTCIAIPLPLHKWFTVLLVPYQNLIQPRAYTYQTSTKHLRNVRERGDLGVVHVWNVLLFCCSIAGIWANKNLQKMPGGPQQA